MSVRTGHAPSPGKRRSWERSVPALRADLLDAGLGDVGMLVEYQLPLTSERADVVLASEHPGTGKPSYVVIALKQWSKASQFEQAILSSASACGSAESRARAPGPGLYDYISVHLFAGRGPTGSRGCGIPAQRHRRRCPGPPHAPRPRPRSPLHLTAAQRVPRLPQAEVGTGHLWAPYADALLSSRIAPSKQLLAVAADEVQRREMFILLDEQRDAYNYVLHAVERARQSDTKTAVVVSRWSGNGKSVIALSLLGSCVVRAGSAARHRLPLVHPDASQSRRQACPAGAEDVSVLQLLHERQPNGLDALILDEAHRIRETSANRWTRAERRSGRAQLDELLDAAGVPVFLLDEFQVVRPGERVLQRRSKRPPRQGHLRGEVRPRRAVPVRRIGGLHQMGKAPLALEQGRTE